ncbi:hypothetical protein SAMN02800692_0837 [Luteibacter sp. UNC138MFCol5.1]|uniref:hypothetical protein n=1 Tax=Luteibacter sp. UNC138MFCol5.1 TaxID=1502774 RepID=UPI0008B1BE17|nr:hypothetical protein [Luteibacter sp. UNC138MFCol5.1]SEO44983.1 hypothetical protein SAMN02800692_0837 [Luteibacter sp. UNC138MFCol5.1]
MSVNRILVVYSGVLTAAIAVVLLSGFAKHASTSFDEIDVQRINIREPDGTLRMVVANSARLPGVIVKGTEQPKVDRPQAGMIFLNDEGSENGGLIFGGKHNDKGEVVDAGGSLSFDRYNANQVVQLIGVDDKDNHFAGLSVTDSVEHARSTRRIWVGRDDDGTATLSMRDGAGKERIQMKVPADGTPVINFLDGNGKVQKTIAGADSASSR